MKLKPVIFLFFCLICAQVVSGQNSDEAQIFERHKRIFFQKLFTCYEMSHKVINERNMNTRLHYFQLTGAFLDDATMSLNKMRVLGDGMDAETQEKLMKVVQLYEAVVRNFEMFDRPEGAIGLEFARSRLWKVSTEMMCNQN